MTFTVQGTAQILSQYHQTQSIISTRRWARRILQISPPHRSDIIGLERLFLETGNICQRGGIRRPDTSNETIQQTKNLFENGSTLSIGAAPSILQSPPATLPCILCKCLFSIA